MIFVCEKFVKNFVIVESLEVLSFVFEYVIFDVEILIGFFNCLLECFEFVVEINEVFIVEFYSC